MKKIDEAVSVDDVMIITIDDGILVGTYTDKLCTLETAENIVAKRIEISDNDGILFVVDIRKINIEKEAIQFFAKNNDFILAAAMIVANKKWFYNFMSFFLKSEFPIKYFIDYEKGKKWLLGLNLIKK